jgi:hypothetical protein
VPDNAVTEERAKLEELLRRQQKQRGKARHAVQVQREAKRRVHVLGGKIAVVQNRIKDLKSVSHQERAVRWAMEQQGTAEHPDGSNWGHPVQDWIEFTGYHSPVPWCGCFAARAVVGAGKAEIPTRIRLGFNEYIVYDAQHGRNGLRQVDYAKAKPGDLVVFTFPHIAVVRGKPTSNGLPTIEGNTSPLSSGSQANGGTVAAKVRSRSDVRLIARPLYPGVV